MTSTAASHQDAWIIVDRSADANHPELVHKMHPELNGRGHRIAIRMLDQMVRAARGYAGSLGSRDEGPRWRAGADIRANLLGRGQEAPTLH